MGENNGYVVVCDDTKLAGIPHPTPESEQAWAAVRDNLFEECCAFINQE